MKSLYIDDEREVPQGFSHYARNFSDALRMIQHEDWDLISFDHDLGSNVEKENGLTLMNVLEELVYFKQRQAPIVVVHTANLAARPTMKACAENIMRNL